MLCILMEGSQVPKFDNEFWKRAKGKVIYIAGKKLAHVLMA